MMQLDIRTMNYEERKYTYAQSPILREQTGSIGRLRGDFDSNGFGFYTTWEDHNKELKSVEFMNELDNVINMLRSKDYGLLQNRSAMQKFVRKYPDSEMRGSYTTEYGFRVDTEMYTYLLRCNLNKADYNFYCFCYQRESLNRHIENARKDIRFVDSSNKELFRLPDGEQICITSKTGESVNRYCRYVDESHLEFENMILHICDFAKHMERNHNRFEPKETPLPPYSFGNLPSTGDVIKITRYEKGYTPLNVQPMGEDLKAEATSLNESIGVSKAQAAAMEIGSMFGWDCPAAKPDFYDKNGIPFAGGNRK